MENDTLVEQVSETIQDTSAVNDMIDGVRNLATTPVSEWLPDLVKEYVVPFGIKLVAAIVVLLLGRWVIKLVKKGMTKRVTTEKVMIKMVLTAKAMIVMVMTEKASGRMSIRGKM